ncbi:FAD-linked oxidase C-terminal domain-containing protein [Streptomyces sp. NPDC056159]|uniref:FAD-binding oxidoreductase n=1 Tax=Streptomyces sp. NPDC056159 TaxID=3155537 RepID=UPI0034212C95
MHTDESTRQEHARDASRAQPAGLPAAVVEVASGEETAAVLRWANERHIPVSVRGGGTGLSGGAVAYPDGIVISTTKLDRVVVDPENMTATVGAGVITAALDAAAARHGLMYAPDPVSAEWSTIGGNIATNAGGPRCLAQGVTADAVASLEVVLADGRVIRTGSTTRKNSTGYDLTSLFVGSEGTLGVVTEAIVRLRPRPTTEPVAFGAAFPDLPSAGRAVLAIMKECPTPDSLELMDANTLETVARHFPEENIAVASAVLVGHYVGPHAAGSLASLLEVCRAHLGETTTGTEAQLLLRTRQRVNPALNASGLTASCDVAVPLNCLSDMFAEIQDLSRAHNLQVNTFAHAGDGNLHPSVAVPHDDPRMLQVAEQLLDRITEAALALGGVISGEHGIGSLKRHHLDAQFAPATRSLQLQLKNCLDPNRILTPGRGV